jgi:hypothetical protein
VVVVVVVVVGVEEEEGEYDHDGHVKMQKVSMFCFSVWCVYLSHLM